MLQKYLDSRMEETTTIKYKRKIPMKAHSMCLFLLCAVQGLYKKSMVLLDLTDVKGCDAENGGTELYGYVEPPCRALR